MFIASAHNPVDLAEPQSLFSRVRHAFDRLADAMTGRQEMPKPDWLHCPDRVWRRHSALLMCQYEMSREEQP
ncbi:MAG: hypothetical protein PVG66_03380 [Chromatiales bacterium]|jgi:hypothetical protein